MPPPPPPPLDGPARVRKLLWNAQQSMLHDRTVEAIRSLEQLVQLEPDPDSAFEAWLMLGQLRMVNPAWSTRAIEALQNASRLRPRVATPWVNMGEVYLRKGFQANAAACFLKALELDPSVQVPRDADLTATQEAPPPPPPPNAGFLKKFRSILGRSDKS